MSQGGTERRRARRIDLEASLFLRQDSGADGDSVQQRLAKNVGLSGVYFETDNPYALNEVMVASLSVPESERRQFPFTRLMGRGRVVRVQELSQADRDGRKRFGVALEFGADLTALTAIPSRG